MSHTILDGRHLAGSSAKQPAGTITKMLQGGSHSPCYRRLENPIKQESWVR
jgi:hypothetical protein